MREMLSSITAMSDRDRVLAHIREIWPDPSKLLPPADDRYKSLPLCVIDAVYSIGVKYESLGNHSKAANGYHLKSVQRRV